jgi:3-oxoacyl-[acyl-carrier protein] reductase
MADQDAGGMKLKNKVALVTGGGSGIGRATALRFAREGANVVVSDVDDAGANSVVAEIEGAGGRAFAVIGNVAERAASERMVNAAVEKFGRLDILVNNAGITRDALSVRVKDGDVKMMNDDQWDAVLAVNLKGTFLCSQAAAVPMIKHKYGRIINTSSVGALGNIGQANYSASKAGVIGLTKTLALEFARYGITVNAVAPGGVKTRMTAAIPEKFMAELLQRIPMQRLAEPEEVAAVHAFLASDEASYLTGQVIWIDGGLTLGA